LRAIEAGKPVKETTLQGIANKLRVPLEHLLSCEAPDKIANSDSSNGYQYREVKLLELNAAALRRLAEETDEISWSLQIDNVSEELEKLLLQLGENLRAWFMHVNGILTDFEETNNLREQISFIKTSTEIDQCFDELAKRNLRIFGGTYVFWDKDRAFEPVHLIYHSKLKAALSIVSKEKKISTLRIFAGWELPQNFPESELVGIDVVQVDGTVVWSRDGDIKKPGQIHF
jgi:hypothetical protein